MRHLCGPSLRASHRARPSRRSNPPPHCRQLRRLASRLLHRQMRRPARRPWHRRQCAAKQAGCHCAATAAPSRRHNAAQPRFGRPTGLTCASAAGRGATDQWSRCSVHRRQIQRTQTLQPAQSAHGARARHGQHADAPLEKRAASRSSSSATPSSASLCCWRLWSASCLFVGKQRFEAPGPLPQDKVVNIPHGSGIRDIADVLQREGVIDQPWVFIGGVLVLKAREDLKAGEYQFKAHASLRDVVADHRRRQGGAASDQHSRRPDLGADRRALVGRRRADRQHQGNSARRQPAARHLQLHPRRHARADHPAHAAGAAACWSRRSGTAAPPICRSRRRSNSSSLPRWSRRRPASPKSARASPRCSSIG